MDGTCREAAVGAGVGVPLGLALVAALGVLWMERRQRKRVRKNEDVIPGVRNIEPTSTKDAQGQELQETQYNELDGFNPIEMETRR